MYVGRQLQVLHIMTHGVPPFLPSVILGPNGGAWKRLYRHNTLNKSSRIRATYPSRRNE